MSEDFSLSQEDIAQAIKISQIPFLSRTVEETKLYIKVLAHFEFIHKKVSSHHLVEALHAAAESLKYIRVPAGKFLYHLNQSSDLIYFVLSGEAWDFRAKTDFELGFDYSSKGKVMEEPKLLETIRLAKISKERKKALAESVNSGAVFSLINKQIQPLSLIEFENGEGNQQEKHSIDAGSVQIKEGSTTNLPSPPNTKAILPPSLHDEVINIPQNNIKEKGILNKRELFEKIKKKKTVLNFENNYLYNIVKRNTDLAIKYMKDCILQLKFRRRYGPFETIGETSVEGSSTDGAIFAYTGLDVLVLDQEGFDKIFSSQTGDVRQKIQFFFEYFKDVKYHVLKRICFLFKEQRFKVDEVIYKEGSLCDDLYFIKSGEVQLLKSVPTEKTLWIESEKTRHSISVMPSSTRGNKKIANILENQFFGEEILFGYPRRKFTAKSVSNVMCYKLSLEVLKMLPETLIKRLCESNQLKQDWRDERIQTVAKSAEIKTDSSFIKTYKKAIPAKKAQKIKAIFSHKFSEMSAYNYKLKKKNMVNYAEEIFGRPEKNLDPNSSVQSPKFSSKESKPSTSKIYISINDPNDPSGDITSKKTKNSPKSAMTVSSFQKLDTPVNHIPSSAGTENFPFKRPTNRSITNLTTPSKFYKGSEERYFLASQQSNTSLRDDLIKGFRNKISRDNQEKKYWTSILESPSEDVQIMRNTAKTFGSLIKDITYSKHFIKETYRTNEELRLNSLRINRKKEINNYSATIRSPETNSYSLESLSYLPKLEVGPAEAKKLPFFSRVSEKERIRAPPLKLRKNKEIC